MRHTKPNKKHSSKATAGIIVLALLLVLGLWGMSWHFIYNHFDDWSDRGTFGDMFGAVNALFSGLAFAGLIITLIQQKEELGLQRAELAETRKEMERQRLEMERQSNEYKEQNKTIKYQRFENTLFSMIASFRELKNAIYYKTTDIAEDYFREGRGESLFRSFYEDKVVEFTLDGRNIHGVKSTMRRDYTQFHSIPDISTFGHYYRFMYRIVKYIDRSPLIEDKDRYDYVCLLRSQLSDYELVMLFYNCLGKEGKPKFKSLVETYALLKNLNRQLLAKSEHTKLFKDSAYGHS